MTKGQETAQRLIAVVVIMAMLGMMGIPLTVILFFATVVYFVWRAVQRSEQQDVKNIFDFYVAANEILRDEASRTNPSAELRRYVDVLRRIEREPNEAPQTTAAIRSLERARRARAAA